MEKKAVALYHRIMRRENFEVAAHDLFKLLTNAQKNSPNIPRILYLDIDGHRNEKGGFDRDMFELQQNFCLEFLLPFLSEVHCPLFDVKNAKGQNNDIPEKLIIFDAENKKDHSLDELYIENYSNTEFVSEAPVYEYLLHFSDFLRKYKENNIPFDNVKYKNFDPYNLLGIWHEYMINMIIELFNNFIYGNLICATAMTRTLIESYVYLSILIKEKNQKLLEDWFLCSVIRKIPWQTEEKDTEYWIIIVKSMEEIGKKYIKSFSIKMRIAGCQK